MGDKRLDIYTWSQQNAWTTDHNLSNDTNAAVLEYKLILHF